ncbi:hypothetical protein Tco_0307702 [Tanacetum coccineum]
MDEVDVEDLTIKQYLELTQNHAPSVGIKVDDITIAEYLEYEETIKTQDYDEYHPHSANVDVYTKYKDHLSPRHKIPDPPLDAKTNPYFQASQSPIHPKITKIPRKYTRENEEQSNQGLDLGANINIMYESMLEELSLANIIVEMAGKTREVSLGIKEERVKIKMKEQECNLTTAVSEHLNERPTPQDELNHGADSKTVRNDKSDDLIEIKVL